MNRISLISFLWHISLQNSNSTYKIIINNQILLIKEIINKKSSSISFLWHISLQNSISTYKKKIINEVY